MDMAGTVCAGLQAPTSPRSRFRPHDSAFHHYGSVRQTTDDSAGSSSPNRRSHNRSFHRLLHQSPSSKGFGQWICFRSRESLPVTTLSDELFLSLTSLFNAHLLPRALSTSPETLLTTMALYYYPLPSLNYGGGATKETKAPKTQSALVGRGLPQAQPVKGTTCGAMDRTDESLLRYVPLGRWLLTASAAPKDMCIAAALAAVALCIRPTMLVFWAYLQLETTISLWRACGWRSAASLTVHTLLGG